MLPCPDYAVDATVVIVFNTFTSDDPSASCTITNLVAGDIEIHKDGGTTQRASDNGVVVNIDFDSVTGGHLVTIDLSDNSDAGFYAADSHYAVRMEGTTVYGATLNVWIGTFTIGRLLRPTTAGRTLTVESDGVAHADVKEWLGVAPLALASQRLQTDLVAIHGSSLTETGGQLAGRFVDFFDQASSTFSVATALSSFKATGFSTHNAADVQSAIEGAGSLLLSLSQQVGTAGDGLIDLGGMSTTMKGQVNAEADTAFTDYDPPTKAEMDAAHALLATVAKQDVIDGIVDAILVDTDTTIPALIAALENLSAAQANAQMVDVLTVDTPVANQTIVEALRRIGALLSGKVTGAGTGTEIFKDYAESASTIVITVDASGNRSAITYN